MKYSPNMICLLGRRYVWKFLGLNEPKMCQIIKRKNIENISNIENIKHYFRQPILARLSQDMMNFNDDRSHPWVLFYL